MFWLNKNVTAGLILVLEIWPMISLIRWRLQLSRGGEIDTNRAGTFALICTAQAAVVVARVFVAGAMARGIGA